MKRVAILCFDQALATSIIGLSDLLAYCGVTWNYIHQQTRQPVFDVRLAAAQAGPVQCVNKVTLDAADSFDKVIDSDIVIVPTIGGNIPKTLQANSTLIDCLTEMAKRQTIIASNCTGAFFLAEAGLLDGKEATTHWGFVDSFRARYPKVQLKPEKMLTHAGNIYCSAGGHACFDLGLHLIERFFGRDEAVKSSKSFVLDMGRQSQLSYTPIEVSKRHDDDLIMQAQQKIDANFSDYLSMDALANDLGISTRTLIRRFKDATGDTPANYLQSVRLEKAKQLLENSRLSLSDITHAIGYEDTSSFSRLFKRKTGLTPGHYRERYAPGSRAENW